MAVSVAGNTPVASPLPLKVARGVNYNEIEFTSGREGRRARDEVEGIIISAKQPME
jgi:hypothetical protein